MVILRSGALPGGFNGNGCAQDIILFKSFSAKLCSIYTWTGVSQDHHFANSSSAKVSGISNYSKSYFCSFFFHILSSCQLVFDVI